LLKNKKRGKQVPKLPIKNRLIAETTELFQKNENGEVVIKNPRRKA